MKYFVRVLSALLIAAMAFTAVACSSDSDEPTADPTLNLGSDSSTAELPSGATEEEATKGEDPSKELPSYNYDDVKDPELENPALNGFTVPANSAITLGTAEAPDAVDCQTVTVTAADVNKGSLILVNAVNALKVDATSKELANLYDYRAENGGNYGLGGLTPNALTLRKETVEAFTAMMNAYKAACNNKYITIYDAYRTEEDQSDIYEAALLKYGAEKVGGFALKPNNSDFRTGYSVLLKCMMNGLTYTLDQKEVATYAAKIAELAPKYGFIQRYPEGDSAFTGIADEAKMQYAYRFVGVPHARVMAEGGYCLEEYIAGIKNYTQDNRLKVTDGEDTYHVFYVAADADGETEILIPKNHEYEISGNNVDGFIVTVKVG